MSEIDTLISDLETATEPNRKIGAVIYELIYDENVKWGECGPLVIKGGDIFAVPQYTSSYDAIRNLTHSVLLTNCISVGEELDMISNAQINYWPLGLGFQEKEGGSEIIGKGIHHEPAMALCIAFLKVLKAKQELVNHD